MGKGSGDDCRQALSLDGADGEWRVTETGRRYRHSCEAQVHTVTYDDGMVVQYKKANRPGYFLQKRLAHPNPRCVDSSWWKVIDFEVRVPEVLAGYADSSD